MNVEMLESYGYSTLSAENGLEGLEQYQKQGDQIAVVVTDMNMPIMDGATMIRKMRAIDPGVKIVAVSGLPEDRHAAEGADVIEISILPKPYTSEDLLDAVRKAIDRESEPTTDSSELTDSAFNEMFGGDGDWE